MIYNSGLSAVYKERVFQEAGGHYPLNRLYFFISWDLPKKNCFIRNSNLTRPAVLLFANYGSPGWAASGAREPPNLEGSLLAPPGSNS